MQHVVLDTNILFNDPHLRKASMVVLLSHLKEIGCQLYIPQVVVDETANHYRRKLREAVKSTNQALKQTGSLIGRRLPDPLSTEEVESEINNYPRFLHEKLDRYGAQILELPDVPSAEVLERAITRRKPFDEKGKGYQDTMIWYSVLELAERVEGQIALVTGNTKDFGPNGTLANDLVQDLAKIDATADGRVSLFTKLDSLVSEELLPRLKSVEDVVRRIEEGSLPLDVDDDDLLAFESDIEFTAFIESGDKPFGFMLSPEFQSPEPIAFSTSKRHCERAVELSADKVLVDLCEDREIEGHEFLGEIESGAVLKGRTRILWTARARFRYRCVIDVAQHGVEALEILEVELLSGPDLKDEIVEYEI